MTSMMNHSTSLDRKPDPHQAKIRELLAQSERKLLGFQNAMNRLSFQNVMNKGKLSSQNVMNEGKLSSQNVMNKGKSSSQNVMNEGKLSSQNVKLSSQSVMNKGKLSSQNVIEKTTMIPQLEISHSTLFFRWLMWSQERRHLQGRFMVGNTTTRSEA